MIHNIKEITVIVQYECAACSGSGYGTTSGCCGMLLSTGECCGDAIPVQCACEQCGGAGMFQEHMPKQKAEEIG